MSNDPSLDPIIQRTAQDESRRAHIKSVAIRLQACGMFINQIMMEFQQVGRVMRADGDLPVALLRIEAELQTLREAHAQTILAAPAGTFEKKVGD